MLRIATLMNAGWQSVQSILSSIGGALFSPPTESSASRLPIGLHQLVLTKSYWIDHQREVFEDLRGIDGLTSEVLQSALDDLSDQLGVRLGSPAIMLLEIERLRESLTDLELLAVLNNKHACIQASMIRDPKAAYANLRADIQLLLENTSMQFINSDECRGWLKAYRPFVNAKAYHKALSEIERFAYEALGQVLPPQDGLGVGSEESLLRFNQARSQIDDFREWLGGLLSQSSQPIDPLAIKKLQNWDTLTADSSSEDKFDDKALTPNTAQRLLSGFWKVLKYPVTLMSRYPRFSGGLLMVSKLAIVFAQARQGQGVYPQTRDVSDMFRRQRLNAEEFAGLGGAGQTFSRELQAAADTCFTGMREQGWLLTFSGFGSEIGNAIATGPNRQIAVVGVTYSYGAGMRDVVVAQYDSQGNLDWVKALGGGSGDEGFDIAIGSNGQIVVVGQTSSYGAGSDDLLLAQVSSDGYLDWVQTLGGPYNDVGRGVEIGSSGQIVVVGGLSSTSEEELVLLTCFDAEGSLEWVQVLGGESNEYGYDLAIGQNDQIIIVGETQSFGQVGVLLAQYDSRGNLEWAQVLSGPTYDRGRSIAIGPVGQIVLVGGTIPNFEGPIDVLIVECDSQGNLNWVQALGGQRDDYASAVAIGSMGQIVLVGETRSYDNGNGNILIVQYDPQGDFQWAQMLGGIYGDYGKSVAIDTLGHITIVAEEIIDSGSTLNQVVLVAKFKPDGQLEGLSPEISLQPISNVVELNSINMTNRAINPSSLSLTGVVGSTPQSELSFDAISADAVTVYSAIVDSSLAAQLANPKLTEEYVLELDGLFVQAASVHSVGDLTEIGWLSYDVSRQQLIGIPVVAPLGQVEINIRLELNNNAGTVSATIVLCVEGKDDFVDGLVLLGGGEDDSSKGVAIGPDGEIVVLGNTHSYSLREDGDLLLMKYDALGNFDWAQMLQPVDGFIGADVALGTAGRIVVVGTRPSAGTAEAFLAKFSPDGALEWARAMGDQWDVAGNSLAIGPMGQIVVVGIKGRSFSQLDFVGYVAQFDTRGNLEWAQSTGIVFPDFSYDVAIGPMGQIVLVGDIDRYGVGSGEMVVAQLSADGDLDWAQKLGGSSNENGLGVAIGSMGQIVVVGRTSSFGMGSSGALVAQFDTGGNFEWAKMLGGQYSDQGSAVVIGQREQIVLVGTTFGPGTGEGDVLIAQFDSFGNLTWAQTLGGQLSSDSGVDLALGSADQIVLVGNSDSNLLVANLDSLGAPPTQTNGLSLSEFEISSMAVSPTVSSAAEIQLEHISGMSSTLITDFQAISLAFFPAVHRLTLNAFFEIDFKRFLEGFSTIYSVTGANSFTLPDWVHFDSGNLVLSGTPTGTTRGHYFVQMDAELAAVRKRIGFILDVVNTVPYLNHSPRFEVAVGRFVLPVGSYFLDLENDLIGPFAIGSVNGTQAAPIASINVETGRFFGTTLSGDQGTYYFNITAADPYDGLGWEIITLKVVNAAPEKAFLFNSPSPVIAGEGRPALQFDFPSNAFVDPDGDSVSYHFIGPDFLQFDAGSRTLTGSPGIGDAGVHAVNIVAEDPYGGSANETIQVTVVLNSPPIASGALPQQQISVNQVKNWAVPASAFVDHDGDNLQFSLSRIGGLPTWISINDRIISITPRSGAQGSYTFTVTANDGYGGETQTELDLTVLNQDPVLAYPIPEPGLAYAGQPFSHELPVDNFDDPDQDPLQYSVRQANELEIPAWLNFNPIRRRFSGVPSGNQRGELALQVEVQDGHGGSARGELIINIVNSAPTLLPGDRYFDRQASKFDDTLVFGVPAMVDPDGDEVVYRAEMLNGQPLPSWITFNPETREFRATPNEAPAGNHQVAVIGTDSEGSEYRDSFNIAISSGPDIPDDGLQAWLQAVIPAVSAITLAGATVAALAWRERRINSVNRRLVQWAQQMKPELVDAVDPYELEQSLDEFQHHLKAGDSIASLEVRYAEFEGLAKRFYANDPGREKVFTRLLCTCGALDECVLTIRAKVLEGDTKHEVSMDHAYRVSSMLYAMVRLMLELHTGRGLIVSKTFKTDLMQLISFVTSRMDKKTIIGMRIYYNLIACKESMISMLDTENLPRLLLSMFMHIISPMDLFYDLKAIVVDFPAKWHVALIEVSGYRRLAARDKKALQVVQEVSVNNTDWRFRYGLIPIYLDMLSEMQDEGMQRELINGQVVGSKVRRLGYMHLLTHKSRLWRFNDRRVRVLAGYLLNIRADGLPGFARSLLSKYIQSSWAAAGAGSGASGAASQSRPANERQSSDMMDAAGGNVFTIHNPLEADIVADPLSALSISSRRARAADRGQGIRHGRSARVGPYLPTHPETSGEPHDAGLKPGPSVV